MAVCASNPITERQTQADLDSRLASLTEMVNWWFREKLHWAMKWRARDKDT